MNPSSALSDFQQTALILIPEFILLVRRHGDHDGIGVLQPAAPLLVRDQRGGPGRGPRGALAACVDTQTGMYSAVALNDDFSFFARLVLLLAALVLLALAHREPADDRAGEFFGALLMVNAGAMLVAAANELVFLFVGLELVSMPTYLLLYLSRRNRGDPGSGDQVFLPEHLLLRPAPLRPGVPVRHDGDQQPEGDRFPVSRSW